MLNIDYIFIYSTFGERAECVVEGHGLDVEGGEDGLLVGHGGVLAGAGHLGTTVTIQRMLPNTSSTLAERMMHMSHRLTLTALRSSLLRGQPASTEILGRFCSVFHSLRI